MGGPWRRPIVVAWLVLVALSLLPYARAQLLPPAGFRFVGFFYFVDDHYNYLSYVEQAQRGRFLFENKLVLEPHRPALVNLEWWLLGRLAAALGDHPLLAYRVLGLGATLGLLAAIGGWLRRVGFESRDRVAALLLVATGGGLGGVLYALGLWPPASCLDLTTGLFPFLGIVANPHFTAGTALLLWGLGLLLEARTTAGHLKALAVGGALALVRPYDFVMLVAIHSVAVALTEPASRWIPRWIPLAGFGPVVAYNYWLFYRNEAFAFFGEAPYVFPARIDFLLALGPAALLAAHGLRTRALDSRTQASCVYLQVWGILGLAVILIRPVHFSLQFLVGIGAPLLILGVRGLGAARPGTLVVCTAAFCGTALAALAVCLGPNPRWFMLATAQEAVTSLRKECAPGDLLLAPGEIGLYVTGLTSCRAVLSHKIAPHSAERAAAVASFYSPQDPRARSALLDRLCVNRLILPGDAGEPPSAWLGETTSFRRTDLIGRNSPTALALYARPRPEGCVTDLGGSARSEDAAGSPDPTAR